MRAIKIRPFLTISFSRKHIQIISLNHLPTKFNLILAVTVLASARLDTSSFVIKHILVGVIFHYSGKGG